MAITITREELEAFRHWLQLSGAVFSNPKGEHEIMRFRPPFPLKNQPLPIAYRRDKDDLITLNGSAERHYTEYLDSKSEEVLHYQYDYGIIELDDN